MFKWNPQTYFRWSLVSSTSEIFMLKEGLKNHTETIFIDLAFFPLISVLSFQFYFYASLVADYFLNTTFCYPGIMIKENLDCSVYSAKD